MKNRGDVNRWNRHALIIAIAVVMVSGCSQQQKDKDIKGMIASSAKQEIGFAGIFYTIKNGVVTLDGSCPSQKQKEKILTRVKNTNGVKDIVDHIQIAPVLLDADFPLKQSVDSVFTKYATAVGRVRDSVITIQGTIEEKELPALLKALATLHPKSINEQRATR